jgi:hypothetical protein
MEKKVMVLGFIFGLGFFLYFFFDVVKIAPCLAEIKGYL